MTENRACRSGASRRSDAPRASRSQPMTEIFGVPTQALFGQLLIGLINGAFYAMLSLGLAVIFGLLNIINFTHGAQYMMGAFCAYFLLQYAGIGYWWSLAHRADRRRRHRHRHRADDARAALQARPPLRPAADVRPRAHHPGRVHELLRLVRPAVPDSRGVQRRHQPGLHVPAEVPRLGDRRVASSSAPRRGT